MIPRLIFISIVGQIFPILLSYWIIRRVSTRGTKLRRALCALLLLEPIVFTVFLLLHLFAVDGEGLPYSIAPFSSLYVILGYIIALYWLGELGLYLYRRWGGKLKKSDRHIRGWILLSSTIITIALSIWGYSNFNNPRTTHYNIDLPALKDGTDSLKIVLVTDIHIGDIIKSDRIMKLAQMIHAQNPDYLFIGGDIIDYYLKYAQKTDVESAMYQLMADKSKVFMVLGNHEYYSELEEKKVWLQPFGRLLIDEYVELKPGLFLIGRDDEYNEDRSAIKDIKKGIPEGAVTLLLDHQPVTPYAVRANHIDLAMHGHTHDGQLYPMKWMVELAHEKAYGHYTREGTQYVISSGYGLSTTPLRIGSHSEIVVLHLTFGQSSR